MASAALHIKDSYYFEIPKFLCRYSYTDKSQFPEVWVKNDPQFQDWEAERLCGSLAALKGQFSLELPPASELKHDYLHWKEAQHENFGKPFDAFLEAGRTSLRAEFESQFSKAGEKTEKLTFDSWLKQPEQKTKPLVWFARASEDSGWAKPWQNARTQAGDMKVFADSPVMWSQEKIDAYNQHLSGKIVMSFQPFGQLKNLYEAESGFCISKFMVVEAIVAVVMLAAFSSVAKKLSTGDAPKGKFWNFLEAILVYLRDGVVRSALGGHDHHDDHAAHGHDEHGQGDHHGHEEHTHAVVHKNPADAYAPLLWTIFFFILGCNLMGMLPWVGAPTAAFGVTVALAGVTLLTGMLCGMAKFGVLGFWANQIPSMDLPLPLAILLKPMIFAIEVLGLFIKHGVLAVRLLANMVAGHIVLLGIMTIAFSLEGAASKFWPLAAVISIFGSTAFSMLELFVAFLQAYVFTFLSALFISAATHKH